jgi:hypothetical protein
MLAKMVAHGVGIDQQDFGDLRYRPAARQRHDRLDAVGLVLVARTPVGGTQLGELFGREGIVEHKDYSISASAGYARVLRENLR